MARLSALAERYPDKSPAFYAEVDDPYQAYCVNEACALAAAIVAIRDAPTDNRRPTDGDNVLRRRDGATVEIGSNGELILNGTIPIIKKPKKDDHAG